jgi:hypothetical protein
MSIGGFVSRNWFACLLVALHTLLVGAFAWIELNDAWNDMDATALVMAGLYTVDYPIHLVLPPLIDSSQNTGIYLAVLLVLGGAFWFLVGAAVTYLFRAAKDALRC